MPESVPSAVTIERLRNHFRTVYKLNDSQVDLMVTSSAKSLDAALKAADEALQQLSDYDSLGRVGHSLKGLFLNMGENDWAEFARTMEQQAKACQAGDYAGMVATLRQGVADVMACL